MTDKELKKLLEKVQSNKNVPSEEIEEVIISFMEERGIMVEGNTLRKVYAVFFNKVRFGISQYSAAKDNLLKVNEAVDTIRKAIEELDSDLND